MPQFLFVLARLAGKVVRGCRSGQPRIVAVAGCASMLALAGSPAQASFTIDGNTIKIRGTGRTSDNSDVFGGNVNLPANTSAVEPTWKLIAFPNNFIANPYKLDTNQGNLYIPSIVPQNWARQVAGGLNKPLSMLTGSFTGGSPTPTGREVPPAVLASIPQRVMPNPISTPIRWGQLSPI